ncbi:LPD7 domain-containing protein [Phenylobacterium sp.]|uniref:LPD7 domain-containing protein n=1 Tax=Phenylobacterium sp. TaxID=1871053 RepID=UPI0035B006EC
MADDALNRIDAPTAGSGAAGDVPDRIRRRYLLEREGGGRLGFYVDATTRTPAFLDDGRRLSATRNDPRLVQDLVAIAEHRGWRRIDVRGETAFRRQVWLTARAAGLEVRGYKPTVRDEQELGRRGSLRPAAERDATPPEREDPDQARLQVVRAVVNVLVREPERRAAILRAAEQKLGARHHLHQPEPSGPSRSRTR